MKAKALDSFRASEVGMVHAGQIFDVTNVSVDRLREWQARGFIDRIDEAEPAVEAKSEPAPLNITEPAPRNKAEPAPKNKGGRNAKQG